MRLSRKSDYALRAVRYCSNLPKGQRGSINSIAESEKVPREFLAKILRDLTSNGILVSHQGVKGGYTLARKPREINFLHVIEAVDGPLHLSLSTENRKRWKDKLASGDLGDFWTEREKNFKQALTRQHFGRYLESRG
jgi:Rrf2 family protein